MYKLHHTAEKYLLKICEIYNNTGETRIDTMSITMDNNVDSFFGELAMAGYIEFHNTVAPNVEVTDRTILYAKSIKS
jgi:Mn-dependent DtxR family transcriptional regulator